MSTIGVYKITSPSGKFYVGLSADSFDSRWRGHHKKLKAGTHHCAGLQRAYNKYGWGNLKFEVVEAWDKPADPIGLNLLGSWIQQREQYWWDRFVALGEKSYNGRPTATGSVFHTKESRNRLSRTLAEKHKDLRAAKWINCLFCDEIFYAKRKQAQFCSKKCAARLKAATNKIQISKALLEKWYLDENKAIQEIMPLLDCSQRKVYYLLNEHKIPLKREYHKKG